MSYGGGGAGGAGGGGVEDILPAIHSSLPLRLVDSLLQILTHPSPFKRRLAYLSLLSTYLSFFSILYSLHRAYSPAASSTSPRAGTTSRHSLVQSDLDDLAARTYVPLPPTPEQITILNTLNTLIDSRQSALPASQFTEKALGSDSSRVVGVTAVVLHWKRKKGLDLVLRHITRYPFIREVIVWNNNGGVELKKEDFTLSSPPSSDLPPPALRIYNSPSNLHDAGKHLACSLATYKHCYFNDDDWLNIYMDSLYTKYLECCAGGGGVGRGGSGGRIASNTMPIIHLEQKRWRFESPDVDLHTGFTWLGTGSFAPRHLSIRFMNQQAAAPDLLSRDQSLVADMFFSLWTNSFPEQMPNDLVPIDVEGGEVGWSRGAGVDQWKVVYGNILDAIRKLYDILLIEDTYLCPDPFPLAEPPPESHTRSPCAHDGCLFSTSLTPFPPPSELIHPLARETSSFWNSIFRRRNRVMAGGSGGSGGGAALGIGGVGGSGLLEEGENSFDPYEIDSVKEYEERWNEVKVGWPSDAWWTRNGSWHLAVDGKGSTCWESWKPPDTSDHFGLTLIASRIVSEIKIFGSVDLENVVDGSLGGGSVNEGWEIMTMREDGGGGWESRTLATLPTIKPLSASRVAVTINLEPLRDFHGEDMAIRKIKFVSRGKKRWKLNVCGFELDGWRI